MQNFKKTSLVTVTILVVLGLGLVGVFAFGGLKNNLSGKSLSAAVIATDLLSTNNFAVLAGSTITNTGSTVINGDLGLSPGTSVTGFPPGAVNGAEHITDAAAAQAETDLVIAYNATAAQTGAMTATAGGSFVLDLSSEPWFVTGAAEAFVLNLSSAVQVSGRVYSTAS